MENTVAKAYIADKLKELRGKSQLKIKDVRELLSKRGINVAENTLYGYENKVSTPTVNIFLALCDIYQVTNILSEFGYGDDVIPDVPAVVLFDQPIIKLVENRYGENSKEVLSVIRYFADSGSDHYLPLRQLLAGRITEKMMLEIYEETGVDLKSLTNNKTNDFEFENGKIVLPSTNTELWNMIQSLDSRDYAEIKLLLDAKIKAKQSEIQTKTGTA